MSIFEFDEELYKKTITEEAREDGFAVGHAAGLEAGHAETARNMKAEGFPLETIVKITKLTSEEIENL